MMTTIRRWVQSGKEILKNRKGTIALLVVVLILPHTFIFLQSYRHDRVSSCNVLGIKVHGTLTTYIPHGYREDTSISASDRDVTSSEEVVDAIHTGNADENIKAIVIEVDSGGGSPVAGEEIAEAIALSSKPVVAFIRYYGASASYWAVAPSQRIFASANSSVGGIGVTSSYTEDLDTKKRYVQIISGKYKDYGNPNKRIIDEERAILQEDNDIIYHNFINAVAKYRNLSVAKVTALANGTTVMGEKAKRQGLIDEIGSLTEVKKYLKSMVGDKDVSVCWN